MYNCRALESHGDCRPLEKLAVSDCMNKERMGVDMGTKLYVGNLSFDTMENEISEQFSQFGSVNSCALITDKFTGRSRGFAFVEMGSEEEAQKAIAEMNGKELDGRTLTVNEARPREDRPRRNFGGGGGGGGRDRY